MIKQTIEAILSFSYFILFYSLVILAQILAKTPLGKSLARMVKGLTPE